jgi:hypothetical protein
MKGVYKGGPLGVLSHKVKFQQDVKIYKVIAFKKSKKTFQGRWGALYTLSHDAKFQQDVKTRSNTAQGRNS